MDIRKVLEKYESMKGLDNKEAVSELQACLRIKNPPTPQERIKILNLLGIIFFRRNEFDNATKYLGEAESSAEKYGDISLLVHARMSSGDILKRQGKYFEAISKNKATLLLVEKIENIEVAKSRRMSILYGIATNLYYIGNYHEALEFAQKALAESEKLPADAAKKDQPLEILGLIFWALGDADKAEYFFKETIRYAKQINNLRGLAINFDNLAGVMNELRDDDNRGYEYQKQSLDFSRKIKEDYEGLLFGLSNICNTCIRLKKFNEAKSYIEEAMAKVKKFGKDRGTAVARKIYGYYLIKTGQVEDGIAEMKSALAMKALDFKDRIWVTGILAETLENAGKYNEASYYVREVKDISIQEVESKKTALEEYRVYLLNQEHERQKNVEQERFKNEIEKKEMKATYLEHELASRAQLLASQTELLANFREDLRRILRKIEVRDPAINELRAKLRELPETVNWKEFDEQFQQVHPEFKIHLKKKFQNLSDIELQICALLRLKLKSQDISRLLSLARRTVENHRHRIRKKLKIKKDDDIAIFLGQF